MPDARAPTRARPTFDAVVVAASMGGLAAVSAVLRRIAPAFPTPVLVVQHRVDTAPDHLAQLLQRTTAVPVRDLADGDVLDRPGVAVVPACHDLTVTVDGVVRLAPARHRSHVADAAMATLAGAGRAVVAVVLTGRGDDGASGVRAVKHHGGRVLVQDPKEARAGAMPTAALATGCVDFVLPLGRIGDAVNALVLAPGASDLLRVPLPAWAMPSDS